jgi:hypothetical protein
MLAAETRALTGVLQSTLCCLRAACSSVAWGALPVPGRGVPCISASRPAPVHTLRGSCREARKTRYIPPEWLRDEQQDRQQQQEATAQRPPHNVAHTSPAKQRWLERNAQAAQRTHHKYAAPCGHVKRMKPAMHEACNQAAARCHCGVCRSATTRCLVTTP